MLYVLLLVVLFDPCCRQKRRTTPQNYSQGRSRAANMGKRYCKQFCVVQYPTPCLTAWFLTRVAEAVSYQLPRASGMLPCCRGLYHCNYCQKDITSVVRIKCAVCQDFDLCLNCFCVGVEITPHRNDHAYRVMDSLSFPLYHPDWGVSLPYLLLPDCAYVSL